MPFEHVLQASRFELKYVIDEQRAHGVRDFVKNYLEPDENADPSALDCAYPVHSLYCDSPGLMLYKQTVQGLKNRFKLRIRFYNGKQDAPAFLEIKRRVTDVICKERAAITRKGVERLIDGGWPDASCLFGRNGAAKGGSALENFRTLYASLEAGPCVYVSYLREAYVSPNSNQVRVTFDRLIQGSHFDRGQCLIPPKFTEGIRPDIGGVVLEMKFTDRFPPWMRDAVLAFNLQRGSMAKYVTCVDAMGIRPGLRFSAQSGIAR